mgnify:CR=1 FL=1
MILNQVEKKGELKLWNIVRFQILLYCYFNELIIPESDLECLTLLALNGESVRNSINRIENKNLIIKTGKGRKKIYVTSKMKLQTSGNIFVNVKLLRKDYDTKKS